MADSASETALKALLALLEGIAWTDAPAPEIKRNEPEAQELPAQGLVTLRDGDRGDPEALLSPLTYEFTHRAEIVVQVQKADQAERDALFDSRLRDIGAALAADATLGGAVEWARALPPETTDEAAEHSASIKSALVPVILDYTAATPLG